MAEFWARFPKKVLYKHWAFERNPSLTMLILDECSKGGEAQFSMRDLAEAVKVSVSTVSRFLKEGRRRREWDFGYDKVNKVCWFKFIGGVFANMWATKKNQVIERVQQFRKKHTTFDKAVKAISRDKTKVSATVRAPTSETVVQQFVQQSESPSEFDKIYLNAQIQKLMKANATVPATQIYSLDNLDNGNFNFLKSGGRLTQREIEIQKAEMFRRYGVSAGQVALAP